MNFNPAFFLLLFVCQLFASITIVDAPYKIIGHTGSSTITLSIAPPYTPDSIALYISPVETEGITSLHKSLTIQSITLNNDSTYTLNVTNDSTLHFGVWYLKVASKSHSWASYDIPVIKASPYPPTFNKQPSTKFLENPTIYLNANGTPARHLILSTTPFINSNSNEFFLHNSSIIWDTIVKDLSVPLSKPLSSAIPAPTYYLLIAHNYDGASNSYTDFTNTTLLSFEFPNTTVLDSTTTPSFSDMPDTLGFTNQNFIWECASEKISLFRFSILQKSVVAGIESYKKILERITTEKYISLSLNNYLTKGTYLGTVESLDSSGTFVGADTLTFNILSDTTSETSSSQSLTVTTYGIDSGNDYLLEDVRIELNPVGFHTPTIQYSATKNIFNTGKGTSVFSVEQGEYQITMTKKGYITSYGTINIGSSPTTYTATLQKETRKVYGRIISEKQVPVNNGEVKLISSDGTTQGTYTTDNNGYYYLHSLPKGAYTIIATDLTNLTSVSGSILISESMIQEIPNITLPTNTITIRGNVKSSSNTSINQAAITYTNTFGVSRSTATDRNGNYVLSVAPGSYSFTFSKPGFAELTEDVTAWQTTQLSHTMADEYNIIQGTVKFRRYITADSSIYSYIPNQKIWIASSDPNSDTLFTYSDETGFFSTSIPYMDTCYIGSYSNSYNSRFISDPILFNSPFKTATSNITFQLQASLTGTFNFSDSSSPPVTDISAILVGTSPKKYYTGTIHQEGLNYSFLFTNLERNSYTLHISTDTFSLSTAVVFDSVAQVISPRKQYQLDTLTLSPSLHTFRVITYSRFTGAESLKVSAHLTSPVSKIMDDRKDYTIPAGSYNFNIYPNVDSILPILNYSSAITTQTSQTIPFVVAHDATSRYNTPYPTTGILSLSSTEKIDSGYVFYVTNQGVIKDTILAQTIDTLPNPPSPLSEMNFITFKLPTQTPFHHYYFTLYHNNITYSNMPQSKWFNARFTTFPTDTFRIETSHTDTLFVGTNQKVNVYINLYDAYNNSLNHLLYGSTKNSKWSIQWAARNTALSVKTDSTLAHSTVSTLNSPGTSAVTITASNGTITQTRTIPFKILEDPIDSISSTIPDAYKTDIYSGDTLHIQYKGYSKNSTATFTISPTLTIFPKEAGTTKNDQVYLDDSFIGPVYIQAIHNNATITDTINCRHIITPYNSTDTLFHDSLLSVIITDTLFGNNAGVLQLNHKDSKSLDRTNPDYKLYSDFYSIDYPTAVYPKKAPKLQFSIPADAQSTKHNLLLYNDSSNTWYNISENILSPQGIAARTPGTQLFYSQTQEEIIVEADVWGQGYYGLSTPPENPAITFLAMTPNPFSPYITAHLDNNNEPGSRIDFYPYSTTESQLIVSLIVYNMAGEIVRTLIKGSAYHTSQQSMYWDGYTDSGRLARNGRYLIRFTSRTEISGSVIQDIYKSIVVFK